MTGNPPDMRAFARVAREHGALLYVDDAHGFGVIGERSLDERCPYGVRGNSIVRYHGESYESLILVGGFSKAYSSLLAFIACPTEVKELLKVAAAPYLYSGPSPVASLATTLAGFDVNERRGEQLRERAWRHTARVLECLARLAVHTPNNAGLPIVESRCATTSASGRWDSCCSTAGCTSRSPPIRWCPAMRWASGCS